MPVKIPLTRGFVALVDAADADAVARFKWCATTVRAGINYAICMVRLPNGKQRALYMHRLLLSPPPKMAVDHKDHNGLNNCRSNLRIATAWQNASNRRPDRGRANNKYGYRGVRFSKPTKKYYGTIRADGVTYNTRTFDSAIDAAIAWDLMALRHHGEFATLNFSSSKVAA